MNRKFSFDKEDGAKQFFSSWGRRTADFPVNLLRKRIQMKLFKPFSAVNMLVFSVFPGFYLLFCYQSLGKEGL